MTYYIRLEYLPNIEMVLFYNMTDPIDVEAYVADELNYRIKGFKYNRGIEI